MTLTVIGLAELNRRLLGLESRVARKVLSGALRAGAKVILAEAVSRSPVITGTLRRSLKVRVMKRSRQKRIGMMVQTREGDYRGEAFYAPMVHLGHLAGHRRLGGSRKLVPAKPFIREAAKATAEPALAAIGRTLGEGIERVARERA